MAEESSPPTITVPVHITKPEDDAPPTLAEPASGPVAEMSGALQGSEGPKDSAVEPSSKYSRQR